MKIGFGIIGCGMISRFHAKAISEIRGAELIGCFDNAKGAAEKYAAEFNCKPYTDINEMLKNPEIKIVTICTPSGAHMDPALLAAKAGKHVVVEKPLEVTLKRCDAIIKACKAANVKLCTIFPSRFSPANIALKEAIQEKRFGRLTLGDTYVKWYRDQKYYDQGGWRGTFAMDGGGSYMNQGIHNVDLLYWLMGEVDEVTAFTATLGHERIEVEDVGVAAVKFKNGALGVIEATTTAFPGLLKKVEIHGTKGSAVIEQDDVVEWKFAASSPKDRAVRDKLMRKDDDDDLMTGGAADPKAISHIGHREQLKDFIKSIETGRKPLVDGDEGRKSVEIILAIYKSAWTNKPVKLPLLADPTYPAGTGTKTEVAPAASAKSATPKAKKATKKKDE
jgi:UDP-N-acetyl-2-amino-2-deoxyglucuronate dehydrogenase